MSFMNMRQICWTGGETWLQVALIENVYPCPFRVGLLYSRLLEETVSTEMCFGKAAEVYQLW